MKRTLRQTRNNTNNTNEDKLNGEQQNQLGKIKNMAKQFEGKNENELLSELQSAVKRGKADGTMNDEKISEIIGAISPMLNGAQKGKLNELIKKLR